MGIIAKYKFNNTLADLLPEFNSKFTSDLYTVTDEVDGEVTTRTIESDTSPTMIRFGRAWVEGEPATDNRTDSLLEVLDMETNGLTSCSNMFRYCKNLTSITCEWDTSNVTDMRDMFAECRNLTSLDLSNFNTSNVTIMSHMFNKCTNLTSLDLSNFNTSNVTDMRNMFYGCNNLTSLNVSNFNTSKVTDMYCMFYGCKNLTSLDVSNFNTSKVTTMYGAFANMTKLTSLRCSNLTTDSLTSIRRIFKDNTNLVTLDISNLTIDISVVTDYTEIFLESPNMKYIKCNNIDTINLVVSQLPTKTSDNQGTIICKSDITNLDTDTLQSKNWNIINELTLVTKYVFDKSIHNNCIPEFNTGFEGYFIEDEVVEGNEVTRVIESCGILPTLMKFGNSSENLSLKKLLDINTSEVTGMAQMFFGCKNLSSICGDKFNTSKVTRLDGMFYNCINLKVIDISSWDISNVTTMYCMFQYCQNLISVGDLSNWNTSKVTDLGGMFLNCMKLSSLNISTWDVSKVTSMQQMFYYSIHLTSLDLSNFDTSKVTNMSGMFAHCIRLTTLDASNWNTSKVTNMTDMFKNTPLLADIGVLYMDKSSLQKLVNAMPTDSNKTLWYKDININGITHSNNITLKKYIEENVEIVLNSPLLEGDTIEVVDGKLCHVHRYEKVKFTGNESIGTVRTDTSYMRYYFNIDKLGKRGSHDICCDIFRYGDTGSMDYQYIGVDGNGKILVCVHESKTPNRTVNEFKQWLQANPLTIVYPLASPYYEDITPLQSSLALRTFKECNIQIITALPIKTKITYRTNITSAIVMEQELNTLDSGVSLSNLIEEEVDE